MSARACGSALARRSSLRVPGALTLALATWHGGRAAWIEAKAHLAQAPVRHAWRETLAGARDTRPWPWADTRPVARLRVPSHGVETFVLAGPAAAPWPSARGTSTGPRCPGSPATR